MFNSFKDKILSKSGQFNYYKSNFEELTKNNPQLMEAKDNDVIKELLSTARTFSNWKYIDYFFKDDFDEKFHEYLKNMSPESKRRFKLGFIRAIMGAYTYQNSLFSEEEMELNVKIQKFIEENVSDNKICDFDIIPGHYNINCFMDDYLTDSDKFFLKDKDIIDAGAFIGDSALPLSKLTSKNVYAFEPFDESYEKMEQNIELNNIDNIIPVKASLTDKNEDITLYLSGNNVEGITSNSSIRKYDTELVVKGMTIDKFVEENNLDVGFIKIDVEGGEQALLRGAINTIKSQKPIIYVSIYHTADDFFNIKPWIDNLNLGYEFEISKERPNQFITDTVLECRVPKSNLYEDSINSDIINQNYEFSVVMAIYNTEKYLNEAIDSVINQTIGFEDNIELILVDDGSTDSSGEICKQYQEKYPNNIKYIYQENQGQANARNNGLKFANGQLINFLDSDDKFSLETFENVYNLFEDNLELSVVSVPIKFFERLTGNHPLNYKYDETKVVDLLEDYKFIQLQISSSFIRSDLIKKYSFNEDLIISEDALILNQIFLDNPKLGVIKDAAYMYRKRSDLSSTIDKSTLDKDYYLHRTEVYFKGLIKKSIEKYGFVTKFIQFLIMYELQWLLRIEEIDTILTDEEVSWLYSTLKKDVLKFIDNEIILEQGQSDMALLNSAFIFKYGDMRFDTYQGLCRVWSGDKIIDKLNDHKFYIDSLEIKNGNFIIIGFLKSFFNPEDLTIELVKSNLDDVEIFKAKEVKYPKRDKKYIGKLFNKSFNFEIKVPLEKIENSKSSLRVRFKDINLYLNFVFMDSVNLSFESNYFLKDNYLVKFEDNKFIINNFEFSLFEIYEKENIKKIESLDSNIALDNIIELRKTYLANFNEFNNKNIYLFMDRQEKADDNAEILYKYAINQEDNINKYFVISKESPDYDRLKLELSESGSNIIPFGSNKHKLLYLFANKIISSHADEEVLNPFYGENNKYIAGLLTLEKYFIQHGIILHDISSWLKRYEKHLSLFLTTSKREYDSIFEYDYNYDKDTVQLLGLPRFDALKNEDKKQIVIMPTWRRSLSGINKEAFKSSEYCKKLSSLLSNKRLIKHAQDKGYAIIFRPHFKFNEYVDCFDINEYVDIDISSSFRDIFNNSSIMITDYSSVAFDFAYLKKPLFYYHWNDKEFHFDIENSYFDYNTDGFGPILDNEEDLVEEIIKSIDNNCKMEDKFIKRVNKFFEFTDRNNCKRVWNWILDNDNFKFTKIGVVDNKAIDDILNKKLISIIIPVYNTEKYIKKAIESVINQSIGFENLELICVDDCSTDNSLVILKEYEKKYDNIKVISLDENSGFAGKPRNIGIENANADYIMFLDSDDYYIENACEKLYNDIHYNGNDLVFGGYTNLYSNGKKEVILPFKGCGEKLDFSNTSSDKDLIKVNPAISAKIFKKELIINNDIKFPVGVPGQDLVFVLDTFFASKNIVSLNNFNVYNRLIRSNKEDKSVSFKKDYKSMIGLIKVYSLVLDICKKYNVSKEITSLILANHLGYFSNLFKRNNFEDNELDMIFNSFEFKNFENNEFFKDSEFKELFYNLKNKNYENKELFINIKNEYINI